MTPCTQPCSQGAQPMAIAFAVHEEICAYVPVESPNRADPTGARTDIRPRPTSVSSGYISVTLRRSPVVWSRYGTREYIVTTSSHTSAASSTSARSSSSSSLSHPSCLSAMESSDGMMTRFMLPPKDGRIGPSVPTSLQYAPDSGFCCRRSGISLFPIDTCKVSFVAAEWACNGNADVIRRRLIASSPQPHHEASETSRSQTNVQTRSHSW